MKRGLGASLAAVGALPALSFAHHSVAAWFSTDQRQEIEGVVTEVKWENPHVRFFMRAPNAAGDEVLWEIACPSAESAAGA